MPQPRTLQPHFQEIDRLFEEPPELTRSEILLAYRELSPRVKALCIQPVREDIRIISPGRVITGLTRSRPYQTEKGIRITMRLCTTEQDYRKGLGAPGSGVVGGVGLIACKNPAIYQPTIELTGDSFEVSGTPGLPTGGRDGTTADLAAFEAVVGWYERD